MGDFSDPKSILKMVSNDSFIYTWPTLNFGEQISVLRVIGLIKASKFDLLSKI